MGDTETDLSDRVEMLTCLVDALVEMSPGIDKTAVLQRAVANFKAEMEKKKKAEPPRDCDDAFRRKLAAERSGRGSLGPGSTLARLQKLGDDAE